MYELRKELFRKQIESLTKYDLQCEEYLEKYEEIFNQHINDDKVKERARENKIIKLSQEFRKNNQKPEILHVSSTLKCNFENEIRENLNQTISEYKK